MLVYYFSRTCLYVLSVDDEKDCDLCLSSAISFKTTDHAVYGQLSGYPPQNFLEVLFVIDPIVSSAFFNEQFFLFSFKTEDQIDFSECQQHQPYVLTLYFIIPHCSNSFGYPRTYNVKVWSLFKLNRFY